MRLRPKLLLFIPLLAYILSYAYLAHYHRELLILNTVVHEGGTYSLIEDMFYASHFLGHVPVHTLLAFLFIGSYLCLTPPSMESSIPQKMRFIILSLVLFLIVTFLFSLAYFGPEDTFAYVGQQKQSVVRYEQGGSWNLHIPSTMLQFFLIPVYVYCVKSFMGSRVCANASGLTYVFFAALIFTIYTVFLNGNLLHAVHLVWTDPRYLAHSVRELLTFPIIYYPIPLYFIIIGEKGPNDWKEIAENTSVEYVIASFFLIFIAGLAYQCWIPLTHGIAELAQKPSFAKQGKLGIPYLLAAHYFEHFLDTIYFTLFGLMIYAAAMIKPGNWANAKNNI